MMKVNHCNPRLRWTTVWLVSLLAWSGAAQSMPASAEVSSRRNTPLVRAVERVIPAVVNISTERVVAVSDPFNAFFRDFFETPEPRYYRETIPLGSGVMVASSGLILTNFHVVRRATGIEVRMVDGQSFAARLVAYNRSNDLALLRLSTEPGVKPDFPIIEFALPDDLLLAETVVAVGNPFGLESSVSSGVLSARNRSWREGEVQFNDILQTDAAINPGNSGGPLVNLDGALIGLNLAIRAGAEGIGFAIPVRRIEEVLAEWLQPSYFSTAVSGFVPVNRFDGSGRLQVVATAVDPQGSAAAAGLREDDEIVEFNGQPLSRSLQLSRHLWSLRVGDLLSLRTADGRRLEIEIGEMNAEQLIRRRLGLQVQELSPVLKSALQVPETVNGLIVSDIVQDGPAANLDIRRGDIIFGAGRTPVESRVQLERILRDRYPGDEFDLHLLLLRDLRDRTLLQRRSLSVILQ